MSKLKLMTIIGTRPEIIRLSETIKKCDKYFDQTLVHTGQNYDYELNKIFFEDLALRKPNCYLNVVGQNLGQTMGNIIEKTYELMVEKKPDAVLVLGDTNSCLSAISAKRLHIPVFHMEAGNRCFDENLPEETNRRIVDHVSDVNMCYSEHARRYLASEGRPKQRTFVTGSPMAEVLRANLKKIQSSDVLERLNLEKGKYILLSAHREENIDKEENFFSLMNAINALAEQYNVPIIYSTHPRSKKFIEKRNFVFHPLVRSLKPFGFSDYNHLQINAKCVVSDSGTLPEESAFFHSFPAVCIRTSTERPEALDK
ncbi:MAG TPA: UDP-N-acetylglucosamine 2-epimerase (non-hydrolyzing), partial [Clostridiales bacterium]|nr:UDP-N-acetylglucosamine 2-epimerase (non-hydrolyzing) [Clostridiales bacterium]